MSSRTKIPGPQSHKSIPIETSRRVQARQSDSSSSPSSSSPRRISTRIGTSQEYIPTPAAISSIRTGTERENRESSSAPGATARPGIDSISDKYTKCTKRMKRQMKCTNEMEKSTPRPAGGGWSARGANKAEDETADRAQMSAATATTSPIACSTSHKTVVECRIEMKLQMAIEIVAAIYQAATTIPIRHAASAMCLWAGGGGGERAARRINESQIEFEWDWIYVSVCLFYFISICLRARDISESPAHTGLSPTHTRRGKWKLEDGNLRGNAFDGAESGSGC